MSNLHGSVDASHGSVKSYLTGFVLSVILTVIPFALVMYPTLPKPVTAGVVAIFAVIQVVVHLIYFLHLNFSPHQRWNVTALDGNRLRERFGERYAEGGIPNLQSRSWLSRCLAERGAFGEALELAEGVMRISERSTRNTRVAACRDLGHVYLWRGGLDKAIPLLEHGLSICRAAPVPGLLPIVASLLGSAYTLAGRIGEGLPLLELAVAQAASMGDA